MSFVQRRRFLWILFLTGLALLAIAANATTLSRLRFEELANQATAVARVRCIGVESRWQDGEIWTETQFEIVEVNKGLLPGVISEQGPAPGRYQRAYARRPDWKFAFANRGRTNISRGRGSIRISLGP